MIEVPRTANIERLKDLGFDLSVTRKGGGIMVLCSWCNVRLINGAPAHEPGCRNQRVDSDEAAITAMCLWEGHLEDLSSPDAYVYPNLNEYREENGVCATRAIVLELAKQIEKQSLTFTEDERLSIYDTGSWDWDTVPLILKCWDAKCPNTSPEVVRAILVEIVAAMKEVSA